MPRAHLPRLTSRCASPPSTPALNRNAAGDLVRDLSTSGNAQARVIAEFIQRTDPDIILINEFDYVENGLAATLFRDNYPRVAQNGAPPIDFPYFFTAPVSYTHLKDLKDVIVTAVYRDGANKIVGGDFTFLNFVPAGGNAAVTVDAINWEGEAPAATEVYATLSALSLLGD